MHEQALLPSPFFSCQPKFKVSHIFLTSNVELLSDMWKVAKLLKPSLSVKVTRYTGATLTREITAQPHY